MYFGTHSEFRKFVLVIEKAFVEVGCFGRAQNLFVLRQEQVDLALYDVHFLICFCFCKSFIHIFVAQVFGDAFCDVDFSVQEAPAKVLVCFDCDVVVARSSCSANCYCLMVKLKMGSLF